MKRRLFNSAAVVSRVLVVAILLSIPLASAILCAAGLLTGQSLHIFGTGLVGETSLDYVWHDGGIILGYKTDWQGNPTRGVLYDLPGLSVDRTVVTFHGVHGVRRAGETLDAILTIRVRWWLLIVANLPPLLAAFLLARPLLGLKRVGRCATCGYDLRATPDRCPECGAVRRGAGRPAA